MLGERLPFGVAAFLFMRGVDMRKIIFLLLLAVCGFAHAIDTAQCGFLKCEEAKADLIASDFVQSKPPWSLKCREGGGYVYLQILLNGSFYNNNGQWPSCNCAAVSDLSGGDRFTLQGGKFCNAGCMMKPKEPVIGVQRPGEGWYTTYSESGWTTDGGANCNPLDPDPPKPPPVDDEVCIVAATGFKRCIKPKKPVTNPPTICATSNSQEVGCLKPEGCVFNQYGYMCVGNPPPDPQPPPSDPPTSFPPHDAEHNINYCTGNNSCNNIQVNQGGPAQPNLPESSCPSGQFKSGDTCVSFPKCPDGSTSLDGYCKAPPAQSCPDGTPVVGGKCPAGSEEPKCTDGSTPVNGKCDATPDGSGASGGTGYAKCSDGSDAIAGKCNPSCPDGKTYAGGRCFNKCADGSTSLDGYCGAPHGACPNGSTPIAGKCPVGGACNPNTDPNHCGVNPHDGKSCDPQTDPKCSTTNAGGGESCDVPPFCAGDLVGCNTLKQVWNTRCTIAALVPSDSPDDSDYGTSPSASQAWIAGSGSGTDGGIDAAGWLGGGGLSCPSMGTVSFLGKTFEISSWVPCSALHILAMLILIGGLVQAAYVIGSH